MSYINEENAMGHKVGGGCVEPLGGSDLSWVLPSMIPVIKII